MKFMSKESWISHLRCLYLYAIVAASASIAVEAQEMSHNCMECRTRITCSRPTNENVLPMLFGLQQLEYISTSSKVSFNHDEVGITQPTMDMDNNAFPSCLGYTKKTKRALKVHQIDSFDAETNCSNTNLNGWRILRFRLQVGHGKACYRRVQNALLNWEFEAQKGKKSMGILSAATGTRKTADIWLKGSGLGFNVPRKSLLATFTEISLPKPLKSLFVVNPVHVVYEVKDAYFHNYLFSSTAYATLSGHLLSGEERVTVVWRKGTSDEVDIEIVSFSQAAPSIGGKLIWPLIGRMQKQFFLSEMSHLNEVAKG